MGDVRNHEWRRRDVRNVEWEGRMAEVGAEGRRENDSAPYSSRCGEMFFLSRSERST